MNINGSNLVQNIHKWMFMLVDDHGIDHQWDSHQTEPLMPAEGDMRNCYISVGGVADTKYALPIHSDISA